MKVVHRKTLWIHAVFSLGICVALGALIWVRQDVTTIILAAVIGTYVIGNVVIHLKRDDFRQDTAIEYALFATAMFIVLASSLR